MLRTLIIVGALAFGGVAFAQQTDQTPPPATEQTVSAAPEDEAAETEEEARDDVVICRTFRTLGSRLNRERICRTRAEWRGEAQDGANMANDVTRNALRTCIPTAGGGCGQ
jgi:hypothetical protein